MTCSFPPANNRIRDVAEKKAKNPRSAKQIPITRKDFEDALKKSSRKIKQKPKPSESDQGKG